VAAFPWTDALLLVLLGFGVGVFGTLVGAGGGFVLTPVLLVVYPHETPSTITAISLLVVFFNAASGSAAYARQRRIDYRSGWRFALATLPGAVAGALVVRLVSTATFDPIMGIILAALALWLLKGSGSEQRAGGQLRTESRRLTDRDGNTYAYEVPVRAGIAYSTLVGFVSSFLGIGGGVIHVPLLVGALGFPTHIATATSHFVLAFMSAAGSLTHVITGTFAHGHGLRRGAALSVGVIVGAQLGALISKRFSGRGIQRLLATGLLLLAARLMLSAG